MKKTKSIFAAVGVLASLSLAGCGSVVSTQSNSNSSSGNNSNSKTIKVAMIPKEIGIPYFTAADQGAEPVAKKIGIQLKYDGPTQATASAQVSMINSYVAQGYNVIALSAIDPQGVAPALKAAEKKGVKVVTWDADAAPDARDYFVQTASVDGIGSTLVKIAADQLGSKPADIAILSSTATDNQHNQWIDAMKQAIATKYKNLHIVTIQYGNEQPSDSLTAAENILKGYPNVKAIISPDSVGLPAAAKAVEQLHDQGKVVVTGLCDPAPMKQYVNDGTVKAFALWDVQKLGALTMWVAKYDAEGKMPKGDGSVTFPGFGTFQVKNNQVLLGAPFIFNKSNIGNYNY